MVGIGSMDHKYVEKDCKCLLVLNMKEFSLKLKSKVNASELSDGRSQPG